MFDKFFGRFSKKKNARSAPQDRRKLVPTVATLQNLALPENLAICRRPEDLPHYDAILSGIDKRAMVILRAEDAEHIVIIRTAPKTAAIVASTTLFYNDEARRLFSRIRENLVPKKIDLSGMLWATPALITALSQEKVTATQAEDDSDNQSEQGADSWKRFSEWIEYGLEENASDIHVEIRKDTAGIRFRIDGELEYMRNDTDGQYLAAQARHSVAFVYNKKTEAKSTSNSQFQASKGMYSMVSFENEKAKIRLRCQTVPLINGLDLVMRILKSDVKTYTYEELGYSPSQVKLLTNATEESRGCILIAGITGSGKTLTMKTIMERIPGRDRMKIASMEDPAEFEIEGVSQTTFQRDVSNEDESSRVFKEAITQWMRGDIDVLTVGEIRDPATGVAALTVAQTGHLAMGTIHVGSALGIPERLVSPAIGLDLHSVTAPGVLSLLMYQSLVPLLCPECKVPLHDMNRTMQERMHRIAHRFQVDVSGVHFKREGGCSHCKNRGTKGMTLAAAVIPPDETFLKFIRERNEFAAADYWASKSDGRFDTADMTGKTEWEHAFYKAIKGDIDPSSVERIKKFDAFVIRNKNAGKKG